MTNFGFLDSFRTILINIAMLVMNFNIFWQNLPASRIGLKCSRDRSFMLYDDFKRKRLANAGVLRLLVQHSFCLLRRNLGFDIGSPNFALCIFNSRRTDIMI